MGLLRRACNGGHQDGVARGIRATHGVNKQHSSRLSIALDIAIGGMSIHPLRQSIGNNNGVPR